MSFDCIEGGILKTHYWGFLIIGFIVPFFTLSLWGQDMTICHRYVVIDPVQDPSMIPKCRVEGDIFYLEGMITSDMVFELKFLHSHVKVLELNSYGGLVKDAYELAAWIRERGLVTRVRKGARCASACTLLFQAGVQREAHPESKFLYHGARLGSEWLSNWFDFRYQFGRERALKFLAQQFDEVGQETISFFDQLVEYGMDPKFIRWYQEQPEETNWFERGNFTRKQDVIISANELKQWGVVLSFVD